MDQKITESHLPGQYLDIALSRAISRYCPVLAFDPPTQSVTFNTYTTGTSGLPDIYTRSPRATGPRAEGVYIRRTTSAHGITNM